VLCMVDGRILILQHVDDIKFYFGNGEHKRTGDPNSGLQFPGTSWPETLSVCLGVVVQVYRKLRFRSRPRVLWTGVTPKGYRNAFRRATAGKTADHGGEKHTRFMKNRIPSHAVGNACGGSTVKRLTLP